MIRTCSVTSSGRTGTSPRPSSGASRRQNPGVPAPFGPNWPGPAVAAKLSMGVDARPEGPLASLGHLTKGELCREQALVFGAVALGHEKSSYPPVYGYARTSP